MAENDACEGGLSRNDLTPNTNWNTTSENPQHWPMWKRMCITIVLVPSCGIVLLCSSIVTPAIATFSSSFHISTELSTAVFSIYVFACAIGPLVLSPLSESYGRNWIYRRCWVIFTLFMIGCALAKNIQTLLLCRFLAGFGGSVAFAVPVGSMADIWGPSTVGIPVAILTLMAYLGLVVGPICGGYIIEFTSWRWIFWVSLILAGSWGINFIWLPETCAVVLLKNGNTSSFDAPSPSAPVKSWRGFLATALWRPIQMLFLEPIILLISLYVGLVNGIFFLYYSAYPLVFHGLYKMTIGNSELPFLAIGVGILLCGATAGRMNALYIRLKEKHGIDGLYPEGRLPLGILAAVIFPASLFWLAWTANRNIHWIVPTLSGIPFGWSLLVLMVTLVNYTSDTYSAYSSSAIAAASLVRSLMGAAFPLITKSLYGTLTPKWAGILLGCLAVLFMPIPFLFYKYGPYMRSKGRYTSKTEI